MDGLAVLTAIIAILVVILIAIAHKRNKFWEIRGVPYVKPLPFFGNAFGIISGRKWVVDVYHDIIVKRFPNEKLVGFYQLMTPILLVNDIELVERVMVKDFQYFTDRTLYAGNDFPETGLITLSGNRWRTMRQHLSPMFSKAKLNNMSPQVAEVVDFTVEQIKKQSLDEIDLKTFLDVYAMNVIGACAFGLDSNTLNNPESDYRTMGKQIAQTSFISLIRRIIFFTFPNLSARLNINFNTQVTIDYFSGLLKRYMKYRKEAGIEKIDILQQMIALRDKGEVASRQIGKELEKITISDRQIVGHSIAFLTAGFEVVSLAILYLCYDLSRNPDIQERVRDEVTTVLKESDGQLTYEGLKNATYLDMCISESSRMHTVVPILSRVCTSPYTFPGTNVKIEPGQILHISSFAVHYNPELYREPDKFDPERFHPDAAKTNAVAFLPFGQGPRMCIGARLALIEIKMCAARLLSQFRFKLIDPNEKIEYNPKAFFSSPENTLRFKLEILENVSK